MPAYTSPYGPLGIVIPFRMHVWHLDLDLRTRRPTHTRPHLRNEVDTTPHITRIAITTTTSSAFATAPSAKRN